MKLKAALDRIRYTVSNKNKPNDTDIEAFNKIVEYFKQSEESALQENVMFAKLYTYQLGKFAAHYKDVNQANAHLNKILKQSQEQLIQRLLIELKAMEVKNVFKDDFLQKQNPTDIENTMKRYPQLGKEFLEAWDLWDYENVVSHLNTNINLSLKCLNQ